MNLATANPDQIRRLLDALESSQPHTSIYDHQILADIAGWPAGSLVQYCQLHKAPRTTSGTDTFGIGGGTLLMAIVNERRIKPDERCKRWGRALVEGGNRADMEAAEFTSAIIDRIRGALEEQA